jgi:N-acetylglucosamine-6-phosphate deacetylase
MIMLAGVPLIEAVQMITSTPARIMGVDKDKGSLLPGKDADIVLFDEQITIDKTIVGGRMTYSRQPVTA